MIHFETDIKARTYECDLYGHVNNATFLNYCELARVEFLEHLGFTLQTLKESGFILPIVKIEIEGKELLSAKSNNQGPNIKNPPKSFVLPIDVLNQLSGGSTLSAIGYGYARSLDYSHEASIAVGSGLDLSLGAFAPRTGNPHNRVQSSKDAVPITTGNPRQVGGIPAPAYFNK